MNFQNRPLELKKESVLFLFINFLIYISLTSQSAAVLIGLIFILLTLNIKFIFHHKEVTVALFNFLLINIFFGLVNASNQILLLEEIVRSVFFLLLYLQILHRLSNDALDKTIKFLSIFIIFSIFLYPFLKYHGRFTSFFPHPNHLAYTCNLLIAYFLLFSDIKSNKKIMYILPLIITVCLSQSSGGILSTLLTILMYNYKRNYKNFVFGFAFLFIAFFVFKESQFVSLIFEKFSSLKLDEVEERAGKLAFGNDTSLVWRVTYWYAILDGLNYHSLYEKVFGVGIGAMSYPNYYFYWMITDPHNDYVRKIAEIGYLGAFIYFVNWVYLISNLKNRIILLPILFIPMFVGNIVVNVTFMLLILVFIRRKKGG